MTPSAAGVQARTEGVLLRHTLGTCALPAGRQNNHPLCRLRAYGPQRHPTPFLLISTPLQQLSLFPVLLGRSFFQLFLSFSFNCFACDWLTGRRPWWPLIGPRCLGANYYPLFTHTSSSISNRCGVVCVGRRRRSLAQTHDWLMRVTSHIQEEPFEAN